MTEEKQVYILVSYSENILPAPARNRNPGRWIYRQTLYHVAVKAGFYRKAVEVYHIPIPCDTNMTEEKQVYILTWLRKRGIHTNMTEEK